jgi:hypothetical protein
MQVKVLSLSIDPWGKKQWALQLQEELDRVLAENPGARLHSVTTMTIGMMMSTGTGYAPILEI